MSLGYSWEQTCTVLGLDFAMINTHGFGSKSSMSALMMVPSPSFKSWSILADIYVIFTPSITVNSTLSNNTGARQSSVSVWQGARQQSMKWRGLSSNASMTSPSFRFDGESCLFSDSPLPYLCVPPVMQTGLHTLYQLTTLASLDGRLFGQTRNTTATALYPWRL
jgi:hypothetical protein